MKNKNLIWLLLIGFTFFIECDSCKKDTPVTNTPNPQPTPCDTCLPPITTTGQKTFGCLVNGKVWLPKHIPFGSGGPWVEYVQHELVIHGWNDENGEDINIAVQPITDTGYYKFYNATLTMQWANYLNSKTMINYYADTIFTGYLQLLRFDPVSGYVAGTFEFDVYDKYHQHNGDTIHVRSGRFDLHL
ncbi:MAG: hypothetical protein ACHQK8_00675 [Bacteroidia bacterium]